MRKLLAILLLLPLYLFAQNPKGTEYYSCCEGHNPCIQLIGEEALRAHNCCIHHIGCPAGGCDNNNNNGGGGKILPPIPSGIMGGLLGGLGGSLLKDANGKNQAGTYAAIGFGVFMPLSLVLRPIKRSRGANMVNGALVLAPLAYGVTKLVQSKDAATTPAKPDKAPLAAAIGAGFGLGLGAAVNSITRAPMGEESSRIRRKNFMSNIVFVMTGNKIGFIVRL